MYKFSRISKNRLKNCDEKLQLIFNEAIVDSPYDFGISCGHRTPEKQTELYKQGRSIPGNIVTYKDGVNTFSKHNFYPSHAVDIVVYNEHGQVTWDELYYKRVAHHVLEIAKKNEIEIIWGGSWGMKDFPHFELKKIQI